MKHSISLPKLGSIQYEIDDIEILKAIYLRIRAKLVDDTPLHNAIYNRVKTKLEQDYIMTPREPPQ